MAGIQDFVYALEAGNLRAWLVRGALAVLVVGVGIYYAVTQFNGFNSAEAMDLAQIGRNLESGDGFSTKFIRPFMLREHAGLLQAVKTAKEPVPELVQPPAYPTLLAVLFTVTSPEFNVSIDSLKSGFRLYRPELYVLGMNVALLLGAGMIFYLWMARAFDNRVAMFAMVLFLGSDLMWSLAISGLPMQFMIFLVCAAGFCVNEALTADETVEGEGMSALWLGVAAVMVGVLTLTRYSMLAIYLPFVALGWLGFTRRMACGLIATLVPLTLLLPWLVRNALVSGNLFGYAWVQLFAADSSLWRLYGGEADWYIGFNQLLRALLNGVGNCFANLGSFFGGLLAPGLFVLGFFHMFKRERVQIARWFWGGAFALLLGFNALTIKSANVLEQQDLNSLFVLFPILAGYGTAFACVLVERLQLPSRVLQIPVLTLVCLLQLYPLSLRLIQHRPPQIAYPPYVPPIMQVYYKQFLAPDELQTCDIPWAGAWYCNRLSLWMPQNREDFAKIGESVYPINAFWLTAASMNKNVRNGEYAAWSQLIELADTYQALRESPSEYKKAVAFSLLQTLGNDQPLPYFLPQRVAGTDHYYYFSNKRQVQELLQQAQGSR